MGERLVEVLSNCLPLFSIPMVAPHTLQSIAIHFEFSGPKKGGGRPTVAWPIFRWPLPLFQTDSAASSGSNHFLAPRNAEANTLRSQGVDLSYFSLR